MATYRYAFTATLLSLTLAGCLAAFGDYKTGGGGGGGAGTGGHGGATTTTGAGGKAGAGTTTSTGQAGTGAGGKAGAGAGGQGTTGATTSTGGNGGAGGTGTGGKGGAGGTGTGGKGGAGTTSTTTGTGGAGGQGGAGGHGGAVVGSCDGGLGPDAEAFDGGVVACGNDLSNVGVGDFTISFGLKTTQQDFRVALAAQMAACNQGSSWDVRLNNQRLYIETDPQGIQYSSNAVLTDGVERQVVIQRAAGNVTVSFNGVLDVNQETCATPLAAGLPALQAGTDVCVGGGDQTVPFDTCQGTLTSLCVTKGGCTGNGRMVCGGTCVNTNDDPKNCGACGNDCKGWACTNQVCKPPPCSGAMPGDLSNLTGDFRVSFTVNTTQNDPSTKLVNQRAACTAGNFWDIGMQQNGALNLETDMIGADAGAYDDIGLRSCTTVNDGVSHDVVLQRVGGVVTFYVDGVADSYNPSDTKFGTLPALSIGTSVCVGSDSSAAFNPADGTLSNVCVMTSAVQGPSGGKSGGC